MYVYVCMYLWNCDNIYVWKRSYSINRLMSLSVCPEHFDVHISSFALFDPKDGIDFL